MKTYCDENHLNNEGELPGDFSGGLKDIAPDHTDKKDAGDAIEAILENAVMHCRRFGNDYDEADGITFIPTGIVGASKPEFKVCHMTIAKKMMVICSWMVMEKLGSQKLMAEWMSEYVETMFKC